MPFVVSQGNGKGGEHSLLFSTCHSTQLRTMLAQTSIYIYFIKTLSGVPIIGLGFIFYLQSMPMVNARPNREILVNDLKITAASVVLYYIIYLICNLPRGLRLMGEAKGKKPWSREKN